MLRDAFARFEAELNASSPPFRGAHVRPVHNHVLRHLDADGTRLSVIADRAGLTRQAITQIVDELEAVGLVARVPDPQDGRAKRVVYTPEGREAFAGSRGRIAAIEDRWRAELGERRYAALTRALAELTAAAPDQQRDQRQDGE